MIRVGCWEDVLAGVECDAVICDPPYGGQTHENSRAYGNAREDGCSLEDLGPKYTAWSHADVSAFVSSWSPRCRGWMLALTSHDLIPVWQAAYLAAGRYAFAPIPCVMRGMSVRLGGDGPSSWAVYAMVARPCTREFATWGTLPGAYVGVPSQEAGGGRGKPDWLMRALVRDYSRKGDLVVDPCAGWGSTLSAAIGLGRRALGAEMDPVAAAEAVRRLARGSQTELTL